MENTAKSAARWVALGALFLIPLIPLVVANSFFFPFITGKAFFFRILVEIAFGAWVVLAAFDARYRPRFSLVEAAVLGFIVWMFIADLFAPNVGKALWSNFERMEGWVLLAHLGAFFLAASSVLRVEDKWRMWFLWSLAISVVLVVHALFQLFGLAAIHQGSTRIDSRFGNSIYFAIYLLFNTFLAGWLALTESRSWLKYGLLALATLEAGLIFFTETRGAILGLFGALTLAALLTLWRCPGRPRRIAAGALVALLVVVGGFISVRNTSFVQDNSILKRIASISLKDGETRFTLWRMSWEGFLERPLTGWGQEGFNYVFNKYYDPSLFEQEAWFDRAHNAFIDWLMAGGLPAFLLYLSLFGTALLALWRSSNLTNAERIALTAALAGYAFHNIFVFDNLYSYIYFFAVLALIDSQVARPTALSRVSLPTPSPVVILPIVSALVLVLIVVVNGSGMRVAQKLVAALQTQPSGVGTNMSMFVDLAANPSFAAQEVREQIVSFAITLWQINGIPDAFKAQAAVFAVTEMKKQVAAYPSDARGRLELAIAYRAAGDIKSALSEIEAAHLLSPTKEQILVQKGVTLLELGEFEAARETLNTAYALGPQFSELAKYAALGDFAAGDNAGGNAIIALHPEIKADIEAILKQLTTLDTQ